MSSLWTIAALLAVGILISALYRQSAENSFSALLEAQLFNLINSVSVSEAGFLTGSPNLGDLKYVQPESGWYWEIVPASQDLRGRLTSSSLGYSAISTEPIEAVPFEFDYQRTYTKPGLAGEELQILETEVVLDDSNRAARFRVMGNKSELDDETNAFDQRLALYLAIVCMGSVIINAGVILVALRPLRTVRRALSRVRAGQAEKLEGDFPFEVAPLADEMNALVANNRRIVERARTQVGNLAHSLKTPIAVLVNEADRIGGTSGQIVKDQGGRMREQVQHYLDRARVAAQSESVVYRTPVQPVLERLVRVIAKLSPDLKVVFEAETAAGLVFAGERQDYEEIVGNLLENASKWARGKVQLTCRAAGPDRFETIVEDDGPGLSEDERREAIKRGRRFDETVPGSGLGLSIVSDTVREYQGDVRLERSALGGLAVIVALPHLHTSASLT
ncbi:ATP-binding protein [Fulvimarina sp. 2208YS6-2-32]|uniref:histidine kinase n=1 Tax=Fulvimarina uroteuthidis TaxID=3098149 RepID=A0ABU5I179_9HYPH|nr:ATP-binding protein [Fulvimarina sp. 2208YS6-2-32]MDY8109142.1 ATP-binding protein [Fulvimarina sp. 2208YS6-2-32]